MAEDILVLTSGLYDFMLDAEPTLLSRRLAAANGRLEQLLDRAEVLLEEFRQARDRAAERMAERYDRVAQDLNALIAELRARTPSREQVHERWDRLGQNYEALVDQVKRIRLTLPEDFSLQHLKPKNLSRNVFHVSMGLLGIGLYELVLTRFEVLLVGGIILLGFVFLDVLRRVSPVWNERLVKRVFGRISRPSEAHRVPSATWYLTGLLLGVLLLSQHAIELGALVLAFGDPVASLVGKKWGRTRLYRDKSLQGTLAFFTVAALAAVLFTWLVVPGVGLVRALWLGPAVAAAGALVELFSVRVDDNLTIPLLTGGMAMLLL